MMPHCFSFRASAADFRHEVLPFLCYLLQKMARVAVQCAGAEAARLD